MCPDSYKFYSDGTLKVLVGELKTKNGKLSVTDGNTDVWTTFDSWKDYMEEVTGQAPTPDTGLLEAVDILSQLLGPCGNLTQDTGNDVSGMSVVPEKQTEERETVPAGPAKVTRVRKTVTRVDAPGIPHNPQAFTDEIRDKVAAMPSSFRSTAPSVFDTGGKIPAGSAIKFEISSSEVAYLGAGIPQLDLRDEIDSLIESHGLATVLTAMETILDETAGTFQKIGIRRMSNALSKTSESVSISAAMLSFMEGDTSSPSPSRV